MGLPKIQIVLVETLHAGNLGSIARLCQNYDIDDVRLVRPRCSLQETEAQHLAVHGAKEVLARMKTFSTLSEALADSQLNMGFTSQQGRWRRPDWTLEDLCRAATGATEAEAGTETETSSTSNTIALVFGREDHGLHTEELNLCHFGIALATSARQPSLNLSHAVAVVLSRIFEARTVQSPESPQASKLTLSPQQPTPAVHTPSELTPGLDDAVTTSELEQLMAHWEQTLAPTNLGAAPGNREKILFHLQKMFWRSRMTKREWGILRACLSKFQVAMGTRFRHQNKGVQK